MLVLSYCKNNNITINNFINICTVVVVHTSPKSNSNTHI